VSDCETLETQADSLDAHAQSVLPLCSPDLSRSLSRSLGDLSARRERVRQGVAARAARLDEASGAVARFHARLSDLMTWLSAAEQGLSGAEPVSRDLGVLANQMDTHKVWGPPLSLAFAAALFSLMLHFIS